MANRWTMRLRSKRKPNPQPMPSQFVVAEEAEVDRTPPKLWTVEQLNALRPETGPGHRTIVPLVRSNLRDSSFGDLTDS